MVWLPVLPIWPPPLPLAALLQRWSQGPRAGQGQHGMGLGLPSSSRPTGQPWAAWGLLRPVGQGRAWPCPGPAQLWAVRSWRAARYGWERQQGLVLPLLSDPSQVILASAWHLPPWSCKRLSPSPGRGWRCFWLRPACPRAAPPALDPSLQHEAGSQTSVQSCKGKTPGQRSQR